MLYRSLAVFLAASASALPVLKNGTTVKHATKMQSIDFGGDAATTPSDRDQSGVPMSAADKTRFLEFSNDVLSNLPDQISSCDAETFMSVTCGSVDKAEDSIAGLDMESIVLTLGNCSIASSIGENFIEDIAQARRELNAVVAVASALAEYGWAHNVHGTAVGATHMGAHPQF